MEEEQGHPGLALLKSLGRLAAAGETEKAAAMAACDMPALVQLLMHSSSDVQEVAAGALSFLANHSDDMNAAIMAAGAAPALVQLLSHNSSDVQEHAAAALCFLAGGASDIKDEIVAAGAVPALARLLGHNSSGMQLAATLALRNLSAGSEAHRAAIVASGAAEPLVRLLGHNTKDIQVAAAVAVCLLVNCSEEAKAAVGVAGASAGLMRMLEDSNSRRQQAAVTVLHGLAAGSEATRAAIVAADAAPALVRLLGHKRMDVQAAAVSVLCSLVDCHEAVKTAIAGAGAVPALKRLLDHCSSDMQHHVERALCSLADCHVPSRPAPIAQRSDCRILKWEELKLGNRLGSGSFGQVYLAELDETPVAAKALVTLRAGLRGYKAIAGLTDRELEKFRRECGILANVSHPNIVQLLGVCESPAIIVMEYCEHGSLMDVLEEARSSQQQAEELSWERRLGMALDAARGILHLHNRGIAHRDLKSPNLLVDAGWRVKVGDFGLSKELEGSMRTMMSATMQQINPRWQAPEVIRGQTATTESDAYAFGYILWELMTWDIPWEGLGPDQIDSLKARGGHLDIPSSPESLSRLPGTEQDRAAFRRVAGRYTRLIKQCWSSSPRERPDFTSIAQQLRAIQEDL